jgi:uncharacterized membrane protein (UPF0127 family)
MNMSMSRFRPIVFLGLVSWLAAAVHAQTLQTFDKEPLAIETTQGRADFVVELAATPAQRAQGLMFRPSLAPDAGMLFDYGTPRRASMWMKNTLIPLDMLFIKADGVIESIAKRTVPHSLTAISSNGRVLGVLELNGGTTDRLGIEPGDKVLHALFGTASR